MGQSSSSISKAPQKSVAASARVSVPAHVVRNAAAPGMDPSDAPTNLPAGGERFKIHTKDRKSLDACYFSVAGAERGAICFHGNGMTLDQMGDFVVFYQRCRVAVLLITMRGYTGSTGSVQEDGEPGMYTSSRFRQPGMPACAWQATCGPDKRATGTSTRPLL